MTTPVPIRRFADPNATKTVPLPGPCTCPGTPHDPHDTATYRTQLGAGERQSSTTAGFGPTSRYDWEAANSELLAVAVTSWTLQDETGDTMPITFEVMHRRLDSATRQALLDVVAEAHRDQLKAEVGLLPKASAAPSRGSSQGNGSRTPRTRTKR